VTVAPIEPKQTTVASLDPQTRLTLLDRSTDAWVAVLQDVVALATNIAGTEFVPTGLRGSVPKVVAAIMHGRELGLPPMTALAQTFIIGGRPGTYAEMQRALILAAGHQFRIVEQTEARCVMKCRRSDWPEDEWATYSFTMQEATRAGYARTNANYQKAPADMLLARCSGRMAKGSFADVIHGLATVEELQDVAGGEDVGYVAPVAPVMAQVSRQASGRGAAPTDESAPSGEVGTDASEAGAPEQQPAPASPPPGRRRAPLKQRGKAQKPPEEPQAPAEEPGSDEPVLDAKLVEDAPENADSATVHPLDEARKAAHDGMVTTILMHFKRLLGDPVERDERLFFTGIIVGRAVESTNDLDTDELRKAQRTLERLRNREQLEALVGPSDGGES